MSARVSIRVEPGERRVQLSPPALIGRMPTAALRLDAPGISEAHAMLSLRDGALWLLALRGALVVDGERLRRVELRPGLRVRLTRQVELHIVELHLSDPMLALQLGERLLPLVGEGMTLFDEGATIGIRIGRWPEGVQLWPYARGWQLRGEGLPRPLRAGMTLQVGRQRVQVVEASPRELSVSGTQQRRLTQRQWRAAAAALFVLDAKGERRILGGTGARIVRLLAELDAGPDSKLSWRVVAPLVWPERIRGLPSGPARQAAIAGLRGVWNRHNGKLKQAFRAQGLPELVCRDRSGLVWLDPAAGPVEVVPLGDSSAARGRASALLLELGRRGQVELVRDVDRDALLSALGAALQRGEASSRQARAVEEVLMHSSQVAELYCGLDQIEELL